MNPPHANPKKECKEFSGWDDGLYDCTLRRKPLLGCHYTDHRCGLILILESKIP